MTEVYETVAETIVSGLPQSHPWHKLYGISVSRGTTASNLDDVINPRYHLGLWGFHIRQDVEIPGEPLSVYSYGYIWKETHPDYRTALPRARMWAPMVLVGGTTVTDAAGMVLGPHLTTWGPPAK